AQGRGAQRHSDRRMPDQPQAHRGQAQGGVARACRLSRLRERRAQSPPFSLLRRSVMSRWVAIFEDDPAGAWIRQQHQGDHFAYLDQHRDEILLAGGLRPNLGGWYCGGLWVMEVGVGGGLWGGEGGAGGEAVRLGEDDPYSRRGRGKGYRLCVGGRPPPYHAVTL